MRNVDIRYAVFSDVGNREINEDSAGVFHREDGSCFVLCDGLGGHGMGDIASSLVVQVFGSMFENCTDYESFLENAFTASQDILMAKQIETNSLKKMKTTATAVVTDNKKVYLGHIGDSRIYVFRKNKVLLRTLDHSIPQMLVMSKEITEKEIRNHPDRNMLLRVLGIDSDKRMFELHKPLALKKCQAFLLCSDGFWELIEEEDMCSLLEDSGSVEEWLDRMLEIVRTNGARKNMDNYSAIAIWCD